jgi:hypothetical protein
MQRARPTPETPTKIDRFNDKLDYVSFPSLLRAFSVAE